MPTCTKMHQVSSGSNASTAVPSELQSQLQSEENSDDEGDEDYNEACAELIEQIDAGGVARQAAFEALAGSIAELSFDAGACRVVQKAFEVGDADETSPLAEELVGKVHDAIQSPHANHVLQKMLTTLPTQVVQFIIKELEGRAVEVARSRFGCRVLARLIENHPASAIIEELLASSLELSRHTWGHHVMTAVMQHGSQSQQTAVCEALLPEIVANAKNRCATYVVERAITCSDQTMQQVLAIELFGAADTLISLAENQFGCHVAKTLARIPGHHNTKAKQHMDVAGAKLQKSKYGRRLLEELKKSVA